MNYRTKSCVWDKKKIFLQFYVSAFYVFRVLVLSCASHQKEFINVSSDVIDSIKTQSVWTFFVHRGIPNSENYHVRIKFWKNFSYAFENSSIEICEHDKKL